MIDGDFGWVARLDYSEPAVVPLVEFCDMDSGEVLYVMDADDFRAMEAAIDKAQAEDRERHQRLLDEDANGWRWCVP